MTNPTSGTLTNLSSPMNPTQYFLLNSNRNVLNRSQVPVVQRVEVLRSKGKDRDTYRGGPQQVKCRWCRYTSPKPQSYKGVVLLPRSSQQKSLSDDQRGTDRHRHPLLYEFQRSLYPSVVDVVYLSVVETYYVKTLDVK